MFQTQIFKYLIVGYLGLTGISFASYPSQVFYENPTGEESEAFNRLLPLLASGDKEQFVIGMRKIEELAEKGEPHAFGIVCRTIKGANNPNISYDEFAKKIFGKLFEVENFRALACFGKILQDLDNIQSFSYLSAAWTHKNRINNYSLENLDFNYALSLLQFHSKLRHPNFNPLKETWEVFKPHTNFKSNDFSSLFTMLLEILKLNNEEEIINDIGHFLMDNQKNNVIHDFSSPFTNYMSVFYGTKHYDRLARQRNVVSIPQAQKKDLNILKKAEEKFKQNKELKKLFIVESQQQIETHGIQEILTLLDENKDVKNFITLNFPSEDFSQFNDEEKKIFSRYLIDSYKECLFPPLNIDVNEFLNNIDLDEGLYSNSQKQQFLLNVVFPKINKAQKISKDERSFTIIYNRLAIILRDDKSLLNEVSTMMVDKNNFDIIIPYLAKIIFKHKSHHDILFSNITPSREPSQKGGIIQKYTDEEKMFLLAKSLKSILNGGI